MKSKVTLWIASTLVLSACVGTATPSVTSSEESSPSDSSLTVDSSSTEEAITTETTDETGVESTEAITSGSSDTKSGEPSSTEVTSSSESSEESTESSTISSEESTSESSSDSSPSSESLTSSGELSEISSVTMDENHGKISGSYETTEKTFTIQAADGRDVIFAYANCMTSGDASYKAAQLKKNSGRISTKTALPLRSFSVSYKSSSLPKVEVSTKANFESVKTFTNVASGQTYTIGGDYSYFRFTAGSNVLYIGSLTITFGGEPYESTEESSSSSSSSGGSSSSSGSGQSSEIPTPPDAGHYYDNISSTKTGAALKTDLCHLIDDHTNKGYDYAYTAYRTTDVDDNGKIIDVYSSYHWDPSLDHQGAPGKGNYNAEGQMFNREHTIPQSVFNETSPEKADLHHLLPTDAYVNNRRGNYPHAEVGGSAVYVSTNGTKVGQSTTTGYSGNACEVIDEYKGDIARIYFYMITRYESRLTSWDSYASFDHQTFPGLSSWAKALYLRWHEEDPVSEKEIRRNNAVYAIQNNRNPFIDHPEYANRIWGN